MGGANMGRSLASYRRLLSLIAIIVIYAPDSFARLPRIESRCTACQAITKELRIRIQKEGRRNHIDMRHRLDSQGKREGRLIDYKISDLRLFELLDGLCDDVGKYVMANIKLSVRGKMVDHWLKSSGVEADSMVNATVYSPAHVQTNKQKILKNYCAAFMEEREEELEEVIRSGKFEDPGVIEDYICKDMIKACPDGSLPRVWIDEPPLEGEEKAAEEKRMQEMAQKLNSQMQDGGGMSQEDLAEKIRAMKEGKDEI